MEGSNSKTPGDKLAPRRGPGRRSAQARAPAGAGLRGAGRPRGAAGLDGPGGPQLRPQEPRAPLPPRAPVSWLSRRVPCYLLGRREPTPWGRASGRTGGAAGSLFSGEEGRGCGGAEEGARREGVPSFCQLRCGPAGAHLREPPWRPRPGGGAGRGGCPPPAEPLWWAFPNAPRCASWGWNSGPKTRLFPPPHRLSVSSRGGPALEVPAHPQPRLRFRGSTLMELWPLLMGPQPQAPCS